MNCFELLFLEAGLVAGIIGAIYLRARWGWPGIPVGFIGGASVWFGTLALISCIDNWWAPYQPTCQCGNKGASAYAHERWLKDEYGRYDSPICYCRKCGARYLSRHRRFLLVLSDGTLQPYLMRKPHGRWRPDDGPVEYLSEPWPPAPKTE